MYGIEAKSSSEYGHHRAINALKSSSKMFHSKDNEEKPWLIVRLNKVATITSVTVGNRKDCCGDLLRKLEIRVGMKEDLTNEVFGNYVLFDIFLQNSKRSIRGYNV